MKKNAIKAPGHSMKRRVVWLASLILIAVGLYSLPAFLSKTEKVDANILLVEGWLPPSAIEKAYTEFQSDDYDFIITTGLKSVFEGCNLFMNGSLIFYPKEKLASFSTNSRHFIEVSAFSELDGEHAAIFSLFVNDSLLGEFTTMKKEQLYSVTWEGVLSDIDSIMIKFSNDKRGDFGDRNLYVREIIVDKKTVIPTLDYSVYDRGKLDGKNRVVNNTDSNAESAKEELIALGVDSAVIISTPARRVKTNRTLTSALAARDWLKTADIEVRGINIISSGTHARRTWMTFDKVLEKSYKIGVVSLPDYANNKGRKKILKTIREAVGLVYYWFILIPY